MQISKMIVLCTLVALFNASCLKKFEAHPGIWDDLAKEDQKRRLVEDALDMTRSRYKYHSKQYSPRDCSGYVAAVLYRNGFDIYRGSKTRNIRGNGVKHIYEYVSREGAVFDSKKPEAGDLVFFSNTYDRNGDGKLNDSYTHIGIVKEVLSDGTIVFIHYMNDRFQESMMNFTDISTNSFLRRKTRHDGSQTPYFSSQLFSGFGRLTKSTETFDDLTE